MKVLCGVVTYNPDIKLLKTNIEAELLQTDELVIVDNASDNISDIVSLCSRRIHVISNKKNMGIAYALNQIVRYAYHHGYEWVLTMDQDTTIYPGLIENYEQFLNWPNVAMINCKHNDRNYDDRRWYTQTEPCVEVKKIITSGTLTNVSAVIKCGGFDNKMFIDQVDNDMCATLREHGYKILETNHVGYLHSLGNVTIKHLPFYDLKLYNYSPKRIYYFTRNSIYFIRKHKSDWYLLVIIVRLMVSSVGFEKDKLIKFKAYLKGILRGFIIKINKCC